LTRFVSRTVWFASAAAALCLQVSLFAAPGQQQQKPQEHQHAEGKHTHPDAAKMKNPVASSAASIAAGKKLYDAQCASCHGPTGKGDGKAGALLKPLPSDLSDADWKHGSTDGEMFTVIRDGARQTGMRAYGSRIPANDIWNLVNYVRSLNPKTTKS
jgi:mono/diheme cytochrome c family protein